MESRLPVVDVLEIGVDDLDGERICGNDYDGGANEKERRKSILNEVSCVCLYDWACATMV